jgi:hypothetical protein
MTQLRGNKTAFKDMTDQPSTTFRDALIATA